MKKHASGLLLTVFLSVFIVLNAGAQTPTNSTPNVVKDKPDAGEEIDSLRRLEEEGQDSVVFTAKYIRYTTLDLLQDSTVTLPIDTSLNNLENYSALYQPWRPTMNLGNLGLPSREMLFSPRKTIGFDAGFHSLDLYLFNQDSVKYYRARSPYTQLYYVNGGQHEQLFRVTHSQNIKPNWNIGAIYNRIGANGFYKNQRGDHTNIVLSTWYQSPGKRYSLLANAVWNTLKAGENGSVVSDTLFTTKADLPGRDVETVRLGNDVTFGRTSADASRQTWRTRTYFLKQFYYIGKIDTLQGGEGSVLPTQRISHTLSYNTNRYRYFKDEKDIYGAFPAVDTTFLTNDSTEVKNLRNQFMYSFYLRGRQVKFLKNEVKLDVGIQHDWYSYDERGLLKDNFQNLTLKAIAGYRFSDRINLTADLQQIVQGRNFGDFLYQANSNILLSNSVGRIVLGAYVQNKSPDEIFQHVNYQYQKWDLNFDKSKISNLSFAYENPKLRFFAKAEYTLATNYLYFRETAVRGQVYPALEPNANVLKITAGKAFSYGKFTLNNFVAYQKSDEATILGLPELYVYNSLYYSTRLFKAIDSQFGVDSRFNTSYTAPGYAINISQFYVTQNAKEFSSYPVIDVWLKASLRRANIFFKYNYINQGLFSGGYYTVDRYPMPDGAFKFGVSWNFYN
ncbi:MAG: hypothetical protein K0S09_1986 [Sphingobacteriaceae bacterium]|jgi:hypothetical protein|nr:hypothetical protein [Sphingobacteriaceae bacterium]